VAFAFAFTFAFALLAAFLATAWPGALRVGFFSFCSTAGSLDLGQGKHGFT
jgi:hypothetical protein